MQFAVSHKLTNSAIDDLLQLLKKHCPESNELPRSRYLLNKHFSHVSQQFKLSKYCSKCLGELEGKIVRTEDAVMISKLAFQRLEV